MRSIYTILSFILIFVNGCTSFQKNGYPKSAYISYDEVSDLNQLIDESQKESLNNSPFEGRDFLQSRLDIQKPFREQYINELYNNSISLFDTIFLVENYSEICINCRADYITIYKNDLLITYRETLYNRMYKREEEVLSSHFIDKRGYMHDDIQELKQEIRDNASDWNKYPLKYGTDKVLGGEYSFYTIIYPNGNIESMYIRAWIPKYMRKD